MRKSLRTHKRIQANMKRKQLKNKIIYEEVFTFRNFIYSLFSCKRGVSWKASVQNFYIYNLHKLFEIYKSSKKRKLPKPISTKLIEIYERGKKRIITPIHIRDRIIQKVMCDYCLLPMLRGKLIHNNGASLPGKGVEFSRKQVRKNLLKATRKFGTDFYVLSFDFKSYFDSIPHATCRKMLEKYIQDEEIVSMTMDMIKSPYIARTKDKEELKRLANNEGKGICLGSQISQIMALIVPNELDHYIQDKKKMLYVRYMDDGIVFAKTKEELQQLFEEMKEITDKLGLEFSLKKTRIKKARKGFTFLKVKYSVTKNGGIIRHLTRKGIVRMRRKLKKFKRKGVPIKSVIESTQSWYAHSFIAKSYKTRRSMKKLYRRLFYKEAREFELLQNKANRYEKYYWSGVFK